MTPLRHACPGTPPATQQAAGHCEPLAPLPGPRAGMGAVDIVDRLGRVLAVLDAIDDADIAWHAEAIRLWLSGAGWEASAGLTPGWRDVIAARRREIAFAALLATLTPLPSCRAKSDELSTRLHRYEATSWPRDRAAGRRPSGAEGLAFDYLQTNGPTSAERIRKMLPVRNGSPRRVR